MGVRKLKDDQPDALGLVQERNEEQTRMKTSMVEVKAR
jgi:hypothetical protein